MSPGNESNTAPALADVRRAYLRKEAEEVRETTVVLAQAIDTIDSLTKQRAELVEALRDFSRTRRDVVELLRALDHETLRHASELVGALRARYL